MKPDHQIVPLEYKMESIGKLINNSKKKYVWRFDQKGEVHILILILSIVSNKFKLTLDGSEIDRGSISFFQTFEYKTTANNLSFIFQQQKNHMKLYINEQLFEMGSYIDVWEKPFSKFDKSKSVNKQLPKESQLDRIYERKQTQIFGNTSRFKFTGQPFSLANDPQMENNRHYLNGPVSHFENTGALKNGGGQNWAKTELVWTTSDDYETKPDSFFIMNFNQDSNAAFNLIKQIYS